MQQSRDAVAFSDLVATRSAALVRTADGRTTGPDAAPSRPLVWARERGLHHDLPAEIHVGGRSVEVADDVGGLHATDDGVAYLTAAPGPFTTVWFYVAHGRLVKKVITRFRERPATVFDTATGRAVRAFQLPPAYRHDGSFVVSQWVDDDGFAVWAHDYASVDNRQGDLLVCRLSTARCELAVTPPAGGRHQIAPEAVIG